jgi:hypothetical protein
MASICKDGRGCFSDKAGMDEKLSPSLVGLQRQRPYSASNAAAVLAGTA